MPAGFPNIRHDPTTEPRYIVRTVPSGSNKVVTKSADGVPEKMSKYQYPVVKDDKKSKSKSSSKELDVQSMNSQSSKNALLAKFKR